MEDFGTPIRARLKILLLSTERLGRTRAFYGNQYGSYVLYIIGHFC